MSRSEFRRGLLLGLAAGWPAYVYVLCAMVAP